MLELNDLLVKEEIDPATAVVMFHRPTEPELQRAFGFIASERPDLYNAYQTSHSPAVEASLAKSDYLVSCINTGDGTILFIGIYRQCGWTTITVRERFESPEYAELTRFGLQMQDAPDRVIKSFDLVPIESLSSLKGRLVLGRPPGRGFRRLARTTTFPVIAILRESSLSEAMPDWDALVLSWHELSILPLSWRARLSEWRGIYLITDVVDGRQYVGSAYGRENILGRWLNYAESGHGANRELRSRNPETFRFSILQRLSPDLDPESVIQTENSWKSRLHTRQLGLNAN